jgi:hypothetical protein
MTCTPQQTTEELLQIHKQRHAAAHLLVMQLTDVLRYQVMQVELAVHSTGFCAASAVTLWYSTAHPTSSTATWASLTKAAAASTVVHSMQHTWRRQVRLFLKVPNMQVLASSVSNALYKTLVASTCMWGTSETLSTICVSATWHLPTCFLK